MANFIIKHEDDSFEKTMNKMNMPDNIEKFYDNLKKINKNYDND